MCDRKKRDLRHAVLWVTQNAVRYTQECAGRLTFRIGKSPVKIVCHLRFTTSIDGEISKAKNRYPANAQVKGNAEGGFKGEGKKRDKSRASQVTPEIILPPAALNPAGAESGQSL